MLIVLFPEQLKDRLFTPEPAHVHPVIRMESEETEDPVINAMNKADLFGRFRFTRALGSETPEKALLILPDSGLTEYWHMEELLYTAYLNNFGALILDKKDTGFFVPLKSTSGKLLTTDERFIIFAEKGILWLENLGFKKIYLLSMGNGGAMALDLLEKTEPEIFSGWTDVSGRFTRRQADEKNNNSAVYSSKLRVLFISGESDPLISRRKVIFNKFINPENIYRIIPETGYGLLNKENKLERSVEKNVLEGIISWFSADNYQLDISIIKVQY
jgi:hypothetical protein